MTAPKTVTSKQLAANRRNAQRSTGPRTPKGKAGSRCNSIWSPYALAPAVNANWTSWAIHAILVTAWIACDRDNGDGTPEGSLVARRGPVLVLPAGRSA